ncbi:MAG: TonB-dependent receptor [Gemmatimonadetes bacterium]|nr:TonB-dependent receptor [Gemmatimonadota bacterium]
MSGDTTRAIADAEVALLPGLRIVRTDSSGAFRIFGVRPGIYTVRVRRVGFEVFTQDLEVTAGKAPALINASMVVNAQLLAEVVVSGQRLIFPARLSEPYSRVARGRGAFFTRELIDSLQPLDVSSLLMRLPGLRVRDRSIDVGRCTNHGAGAGGPGNLHVFVDGVRRTNYNSSLGVAAWEALREIVISSVQMVEVHTSINTIPPEYSPDACAVILVWSK